MKPLHILILLAVGITSCQESSSALPTTGRVFRESIENGALKLIPVSGVDVVAQRTDVCVRKKWSLGEASSTGIDSFLVRTNSHGQYRVPDRMYPVCSYAVMRGTVLSPYTHSLSARVAKNPVTGDPELYGWLGDNDVVLKTARKGRDRVRELADDINMATGSYAVSEAIRKEVYFKSLQEICELHREFPEASSSLYEDLTRTLGKQCD